MHIIKLDAIDSTNSYLKELDRENPLKDGTIVITDHQTHGRGQQGASWLSDKGKNLTFSVLKKIDSFEIADQFYLSMAVSMAIIRSLNSFGITSVVKWPNDILAEHNKIAGILIENTIKNNTIVKSVIGIGINVNQINFDKAIKQVTSMKIISGHDWNIDAIMSEIVGNLEHFFDLLEQGQKKELYTTYLKNLYRFQVSTSFTDNSGAQFMGKIVDVAPDGQLGVATSDGSQKSYIMKSIRFSDW